MLRCGQVESLPQVRGIIAIKSVGVGTKGAVGRWEKEGGREGGRVGERERILLLLLLLLYFCYNASLEKQTLSFTF